MAAPFVYIASLIRTGSTLLAELLTQPGRTFIHSESLLANGGLSVFNLERVHGDDPEWAPVLTAYSRAKRSGNRQAGFVPAFAEHVVPVLASRFQQFGVKEIYHGRWRDLVEGFPDARVVATVRDPRDLYLSLLEMREHHAEGGWRWSDLSVGQAAELVAAEYANLRALVERTGALVVRYEDLCVDPAALERVKRHIGSPLQAAGQVGRVNADHPNRSYEVRKHGGGISSRAVGRWRSETDAGRLRDAERFQALLGEYSADFDYS